jgi:hypothetical protein
LVILGSFDIQIPYKSFSAALTAAIPIINLSNHKSALCQKIVDGKLYLSDSRKIQKKWQKDIPGCIEKANNIDRPIERSPHARHPGEWLLFNVSFSRQARQKFYRSAGM